MRCMSYYVLMTVTVGFVTFSYENIICYLHVIMFLQMPLCLRNMMCLFYENQTYYPRRLIFQLTGISTFKSNASDVGWFMRYFRHLFQFLSILGWYQYYRPLTNQKNKTNYKHCVRFSGYSEWIMMKNCRQTGVWDSYNHCTSLALLANITANFICTSS